jgi:hypothetical protein
MLLSYLVTSRARRDLLHQLWVARAVGSVSDLARRAGVSFATAHKELESMRAEGLATSERAGRTLLYRANRKHPQSALLRRLLNEGAATGRTVPPAGAEQVRGWLAAVGAPLLVAEAVPDRPPGLEEVVAQGLALSHDDATVARVLPVVLWTQRDRLDASRLVREATRVDERQTLGFFLELTGRLPGMTDSRPSRAACATAAVAAFDPSSPDLTGAWLWPPLEGARHALRGDGAI